MKVKSKKNNKNEFTEYLVKKPATIVQPGTK
jgi:hypothetical protein